MNYEFPIIKTINDVLPAIEGCEEFKVLKKDNYTIIDYVIQAPHTFPFVFEDRADIAEYNGYYKVTDIRAAIKRECRGLAFYPDGRIMSRPFHKFFNYGEKPEEQKYLPEVFTVLKKMDGSMIRPLDIHGNIRLGTRKGITDVAMQAEKFIADKPWYSRFMQYCMEENVTPIFEWCSRKNQIVLDYPEDNLILLALRNNTTGHYISFDSDIFSPHIAENDVTVVEVVETTDFLKAKDLTDEEGYVIVYPDGHRLKVKSDWYVTLHKAKELIGREKDLISLYLKGGIDDILPLLPSHERNEVIDFLAKLTEETFKTAKQFDAIFSRLVTKMPEKFTRKQFALEVLKLDIKYKYFMFQMLTGETTLEILYEVLKKATCNNKKLQECRWLFGNIKFKEKTIE